MIWLKNIKIILAILILLVITWHYVSYKNNPYIVLANSWAFQTNKSSPVVGDLGGIPISIPAKVARFVEYEDDPHFLEKRQEPAPKRTFQSKFRSFGFDVRFPDMAFLNKNETIQEKGKSNIYNTRWLSVGVSVKPCHDELSLKRQVDAIPSPSKIWVGERLNSNIPAKTWKEEHGYQRLPDTLYGLVVNEVSGYDDIKRYKIPGNGSGDSNIYYHVDELGKIDNYIRCSNIKHDAAPCNQDFVLPTTKNTIISVHYRIGYLPQWREIQDSVSKVILGFAVSP